MHVMDQVNLLIPVKNVSSAMDRVRCVIAVANPYLVKKPKWVNTVRDAWMKRMSEPNINTILNRLLRNMSSPGQGATCSERLEGFNDGMAKARQLVRAEQKKLIDPDFKPAKREIPKDGS